MEMTLLLPAFTETCRFPVVNFPLSASIQNKSVNSNQKFYWHFLMVKA